MKDVYCTRRESDNEKPSYWHQSGTKSLSPLTLGRMIDVAAGRWGDKDAFVSLYQGHRITYREARDKVGNDRGAKCVTLQISSLHERTE
jgi:hypothetical protein